jgi:ABC-type cobalamin/Fe3+-siderophores transport system ATPase subunit
MALVKIENVSIERGDRLVVRDFSATLEPGKITAIIGPNGSGKSSLLSAIAGDLPVSAGNIYFGDRDLCDLSDAVQAKIRSVVQQNRNYWLSYTAREVIEMGQNGDALLKVDEVMDALEINHFAEQRVTTLSGGEAQRIEIARALIRDSEVYLFDEPLSAQDSASKVRIINYLQKLRDAGKTIVVIAHIDREALTWCDQVINTLAD